MPPLRGDGEQLTALLSLGTVDYFAAKMSPSLHSKGGQGGEEAEKSLLSPAGAELCEMGKRAAVQVGTVQREGK